MKSFGLFVGSMYLMAMKNKTMAFVMNDMIENIFGFTMYSSYLSLFFVSSVVFYGCCGIGVFFVSSSTIIGTKIIIELLQNFINGFKFTTMLKYNK